MFTVPSIQSESNLLALSQAKTQKLSTQMKNHSHASGFHRSTNRRHATQQNGKHHFAMPSIIDSHDMGLRTVYSPDARN
ncbi:hypothetical protein TNCV_271351 [Trichonephila clavipes]|nr:hypothetical protein TNCV_271351 [Trichonephila clavipes]